jgi:hypothetical protein
MKFTRWQATPIFALILTIAAGCASTSKPVKCDARLEAINRPALPANAVPIAKAPQAATAPLANSVSEDGKGTP